MALSVPPFDRIENSDAAAPASKRPTSDPTEGIPDGPAKKLLEDALKLLPKDL